MSRTINRVRNSFQLLLTTLQKGAVRRATLRRRRGDLLSPVAQCAEVLETRALLSAGTIDPTFGNSGITAPLANNPAAAAGSTAIQSNGETVVASTYWTNYLEQQNHLVLARYTTSGTLDTTFGTNGVVDMTFGKLAVLSLTTVAIQADGKILVAGGLDGNVVSGGYSNNAIEVWRFTAAGKLDKTFGSNGAFSFYPASHNNIAESLAIDPQGRIILNVQAGNGAGSTVPGANLVRLNSNGTLDTTFGNKGLDETGVGGYGDNAIVLQSSTSDPNGYEILVGGVGPVAGPGVFPREQLMVARFGSNGSLDTSFGTGGTALVTPALDPSQTAAGDYVNLASAHKLALEADGSIVAAGLISVRSPSRPAFIDPVVIHFSAGGVVDTSFGNGGDAVSVYSPEGYQVGGLNDVKIDGSGNILVVGTATSSTGASYSTLIRYTSTGQLDTTFGVDGTGFVFAGSGDSGLSINIDPTTGKLVVTINGSSGFQLIRYTDA